MTIKFPKEEENLSPQDAHIAYKHLVGYHLHFLKLQSKCEFFYWKLMGVFFLSVIGAFILHSNGIITNPLIAISLVGFGCLLVFAQTIQMDLEYVVNAASCVEKGVLIEEKHAYSARLFKIFKNNKTLTYQSLLLSRSVPFLSIGLSTLVAGTTLAEKLGIWAAVIASSLITIGLWAFAKHYVNIIRQVVLRG